MKKRIIALLAVLALVLGLAACAPGGEAAQSAAGPAENTGEMEHHKIAVLVYDRGDDEVQSFKKYLTEYIGEGFDTEFIYSDSSRSADDSAEFIQEAAEYGAEGVMSFVTYDLVREVALCEQLGLYYIIASGTVSNEDFAVVEDSKAFIGAIGPGAFIEYKAGADMARHYVEEHPEQKEYFIFSGGGCLGNEMHKQRTMGILDTLKTAYGVSFDEETEEIAVSDEPVSLTEGELKIVVCPGYHSIDSYLEMAKSEYAAHPYSAVLAVLPATHVLDEIRGADLATVDCYSETNLQLFADGRMDYLVGKYSSIIGPSFAAMYNAVTGHAEEMRQNGKAFHITQGFWISDGVEDFNEKYVFSSSIEVNAYNYADLQKVMLLFNPDSTLEDLKALAEAYTYKDAVERRSQEG